MLTAAYRGIDRNILELGRKLVEAVPWVDANGRPFDAATRKLMHTLGRVAIISGGVFVANWCRHEC